MIKFRAGIPGFTLIEVLVFVSVISVFIVVAAAVVSISIRDMQLSEHKIIASRYADELMAWIKSKREIDWYSFSQHAGTYCFNSTLTFSADPNADWPSSGGCAANDFSFGTPAIFKREVQIQTQGTPATQANTTVTVSWKELGNTYSVPLQQLFTVWEQ